MIFKEEEKKELLRKLNELLVKIDSNVIEEKHKWQLLITKTDNGFLLENPYNDNIDNFNSLVVEQGEGLEDESFYESNMIQLLLRNIREYFGLYYSKHKKHNCVIKITEKE